MNRLVLARPFGIPVEVTPAWFVAAAVLTFAYGPSVERQLPAIGAFAYVVALAIAVLLYVSVLLHELSHSIVAVRFGLRVRRISLHLLGGVSEIEGDTPTPGRDALISFAGPAVSLALGVLGWVALRATPDGTVLHVLCGAMAVSNIVVGVFNLLPGLPLDGGRMLQAGLWRLTGSRVTAARAAAWIGRAVAVAAVGLPLLLSYLAGWQLDAFTIVWGLLLGAYIWSGATEALAGAAVRERLPGLSARALAAPFVAVAAGTPLAEAVRQARESGLPRAALVLTDSAGRTTAIVDGAAVRATPEERRPWLDVANVARRVTPEVVIPADAAGADLLGHLARHPAGEYLVVDEDGAVVGVLRTTEVERALGNDSPAGTPSGAS
ncbi:MAG: M50 family metallopeptidase [Actinomycetales bacterium]